MEVPSSPPRTTLLGTIFSPVFNFFSPAKNGTNRSIPRRCCKPRLEDVHWSHAARLCVPASSGSDSPDQALEAEEIVKQLDIEQPVETATSTATSTQEVCAPANFYSSVSQLPPLRPAHMPELPPTVVAGELEADADLPPLTGTSRSHSGFPVQSGESSSAPPTVLASSFLILFLLCSQLQAPARKCHTWTLLPPRCHRRRPTRKTGKSLTRECAQSERVMSADCRQGPRCQRFNLGLSFLYEIDYDDSAEHIILGKQLLA